MDEVEKAESTPKTVTASLRTETGQPRLVKSSHWVNAQKDKELQMPTSIYTYDCMAGDDVIAPAIGDTNRKAFKSIFTGEYVGTGSEKSKVAAEFLNYNIHNMEYGTWMNAVNDMLTCLKYGFSLQNIVLSRKGYGKYANSLTLKKLAPRDQKTLYAWLFDKDFREVLGFVQKPNRENTNAGLPPFMAGGIAMNDLGIVGNRYNQTYPVLKSQQYLHFTYNSTNHNPEGDTPLNACYRAWKEISLIRQYECVGVTKDLGGLMVLRVPSNLVEEATDPENPNHATSSIEYANIQEDAAKLHTGEGSLVVLTSDQWDSGGKYLYDLEIKGIQGAGRQYQTTEIIDQKVKSIYNCFGAAYLILGQDGSGSYALSTTHNSTHGFVVENLVMQCCDVLNNQLAKRILAANEIYLDDKDMPYFKPRDPDELDLETLGKYLQRAGSVNKLTKEQMEFLCDKAGLPLEGIDQIDFTDKGQSGAGEGMATAGPGTSKKPGGGDKSVSNNENAMNKSLVKIDEYGEQFVFSDLAGNLHFIDKKDIQ